MVVDQVKALRPHPVFVLHLEFNGMRRFLDRFWIGPSTITVIEHADEGLFLAIPLANAATVGYLFGHPMTFLKRRQAWTDAWRASTGGQYLSRFNLAGGIELQTYDCRPQPTTKDERSPHQTKK